MTRSDDDDYEDFPHYGAGIGSLHDLGGEEPAGRLAGLGSVAQQHIRLVGSQPRPRRVIGFHIPKVRR